MTINTVAQRVHFNSSLLNKIIILFLIILFNSISLPCFAQETMNINLSTLDDSLNDGLVLKNDKSYRDVYFTKPQTCSILGGSTLVINLNHSSQLIPERSYLQI